MKVLRVLVASLLNANVLATQLSQAVRAEAIARRGSRNLENSSRGKPPLLMIGINTAAVNVELREAHRGCWMKHNFLSGDNPLIVAKFIVAKPDPGTKVEQILNADMAENADIVQVDAPEGYYNLTKKVVQFFHWAADNTDAEFVMKMDDDNYPNLGHLKENLEAVLAEHKKYSYLGDLLPQARTGRNGKYAESWATWPEEFFPPYNPGTGYVVQSDLNKVAFGNNFTVNLNYRPLLNNEDANTGLWIQNANLSGIPVNYLFMRDRTDDSCVPIGEPGKSGDCCSPDKSEYISTPGWPNPPQR